LAIRSGARLLLAGILLAAGVTACADNDLTEYTLNQPSNGKGKAPELTDLRGQSRVEIVVTDNIFTPRHIMISPGTTVVWVNEGRNSHNVMPSEGDQFNKTDLPVGGQIEVTFDKLGTIPYYCTIHGSKHRGQTGTIIVA
jgi:plastocyanin